MVGVRAGPYGRRHLQRERDATSLERWERELDRHLDGLAEIQVDQRRVLRVVADRERVERAR